MNIIPEWDQLSLGLNRILLDSGSSWRLGWFRRGTIAIHAFPTSMQIVFDEPNFYLDFDFIKKLKIQYDFEGGEVTCTFTKAQARCYQLIRVLLHEIGHHCDLITNRKGYCSRGERFAENFTDEWDAKIWPAYLAVFGDPRRE